MIAEKSIRDTVVGQRVRRLRENCRLSVRELAAKVGVSASFIYQLEQGKVSPSFSTLKAISQTLGANMSVLVGDALPEEWEVVRQNRRKRYVTSNPHFRAELLTFMGPRNKRMQPVVFSLEPGAEQEGFIYAHDREDFVFVHQGRLEVFLDNRSYVLEAGDAAYFMFDHPIKIKNPGDEPVVGLWVISPPGV